MKPALPIGPLVLVLAIISLALPVTARDASADDRPPAFDVAPLAWRADDVALGPWTTSSTIFVKSSVRLLVVASWCPVSDELMKKLRTNPAVHKRVDAVLVYEDDATHGTSRDAGRPSADQAAAPPPANDDGRPVVSFPAFFHPRRGVAKRRKALTIPVYVIRKGQFAELVTSYPTAIKCTPVRCFTTVRPDE